MHRFLHSSDLHLGRQFGQFPAEVSVPLAEARFDVIGALAAAARGAGASSVLLAGDTWDSETPSDRVLRQSLDRFAAETDIHWYLLPGNHDPIGHGALWSRLAEAGVANLTPLTEALPHEISQGVWLLPSPCTRIAALGDPTEWMAQAATPEGAHRIGLAHGSVLSFGEADADSVISPNRARDAGLDYLALGDWHGWLAFGDRTLYAGTPEPDRFREGSGCAACVTLEGGDRLPGITQARISKFQWLEAEIDVASEAAPAEALDRLLQGDIALSDTILSLRLSGTVRPELRSTWVQAVEDTGLSLRHLRLDDSALVSLVAAEDLDLIDRQGALRVAADQLLTDSRDMDASAEDRAAAALALDLMFTWSVQDGVQDGVQDTARDTDPS